MSDKQGLLPLVNQEVGYAVRAEYSQGGEEYSRNLLLRLSQGDNPCIANFISHVALGSNDKKAVLDVGLMVYRLLESQAEADKLNKGL